MFVVHSFAKVGFAREAMFDVNSLAKTNSVEKLSLLYIISKLKEHPKTDMIIITQSLFPTQ
jgi:hypothetical protein